MDTRPISVEQSTDSQEKQDYQPPKDDWSSLVIYFDIYIHTFFFRYIIFLLWFWVNDKFHLKLEFSVQKLYFLFYLRLGQNFRLKNLKKWYVAFKIIVRIKSEKMSTKHKQFSIVGNMRNSNIFLIVI